MVGYATVFAVALVVTLLLTPRVRRFAEARGVVQPPDERRAHPRPVAALGGVAMFGGFCVALGVAALIPQFRHTVFADPREVVGIALGAAIIWAVGVADDVAPLSPPAKMAGMFVASAALVLFGVTMFYFRLPFLGFLVLSPDMLPLITTVWVVLLANAVNLIDGLDGLAAGIVAIASAALFLYGTQLFDAGLLTADNPGPLVAAIACGVCIGFLPANRHPASIFMGDGGALFLGLLMAVSSSLLVGRIDTVFAGRSFFFYFPLLTPLVILGVPVLDTALAFARRTVRGRSFAGADRRHVHYRLLEMGHGHRRVVFILWFWTALLSVAALLPVYTGRGEALIPIFGAAIVLLLYMFLHPGVRQQRAALDEATTSANGGLASPAAASAAQENSTHSEGLGTDEPS